MKGRKARRAATIEAVRARHPSARRSLHLVDVDNLLGDPGTVDGARIRTVLAAYRSAADFRFGDQVVVATSCRAQHALAVHQAWPEARHRWRDGQDGADMVLLEEATETARTGRFPRVVIGSGDRIFLEAMDRLRAVDVHVDVQGRLDDQFAYGTLQVHPHVLRSVLGGVAEVLEYQVRQTATGVDVSVRTSGPVDTSALSGRLAAALEAVGLQGAEASVTAVPSLDRAAATGKLRRFVPLQPAAATA